MAIPRKKVFEKIAGYRKGIDYHLDDHIPSLIGKADEGLVQYWWKEVSARIREMEGWAGRLSKNDDILTEPLSIVDGSTRFSTNDYENSPTKGGFDDDERTVRRTT